MQLPAMLIGPAALTRVALLAGVLVLGASPASTAARPSATSAAAAPASATSAATPQPSPVRITITFAHHSRPTVLSILATRRPVIIGRVTASDGHGLTGVLVSVIERLGGGPPTIGGSIRSGPHGLFAIVLPPGGARAVGVVGEGARSNILTVQTATRVSLAAAPRAVRANGVVRFSGRVADVGAGLIVALQVRKPTGYQTFEIVHTRAGGAFVGRYRFSVGGFRYRIRALVVVQNGFASPRGVPFGPSESGAVTIAVLK
ncbi:MAG: hypothetical protein LC713_01690 [Actinobacteria bacterium]|nr:hypothetical protein [Actinomycetota bacterium]